MAVACSPRPSESRKVYFENDEIKSSEARDRFDSSSVIFLFKYPDYSSLESLSHFTYSDMLHIIVTVFQNQPLSLKFLSLEKVFKLDLDLKELPLGLQEKAEKEDRLARLNQLIFTDILFLLKFKSKLIIINRKCPGFLHNLRANPSVH